MRTAGSLLKISEMANDSRKIETIYQKYPCNETSGILYTYLLKRSTHYLFDRYSYQNTKVLDIGCGYGWVAEAFAKKGATACATDINSKLCSFSNIRFKKKELDIMVVCCDGEQTPFINNAFDIAVFNASLHHFPKPAEGLKETLRTANNLYIINEPRQVTGLSSLVESALRLFNSRKQYFAKAGQNYNSVMDNEQHQHRFNTTMLASFLSNKGCIVYTKGYWCYVPPFLQKTNNKILILLWKATIEATNILLQNFSHTFFLKATNVKTTVKNC